MALVCALIYSIQKLNDDDDVFKAPDLPPPPLPLSEQHPQKRKRTLSQSPPPSAQPLPIPTSAQASSESFNSQLESFKAKRTQATTSFQVSELSYQILGKLKEVSTYQVELQKEYSLLLDMQLELELKKDSKGE